MRMIEIGFGTDFVNIKKLGLEPLVVGISGTIIVCVIISYVVLVILGF